MNEIFEQNEGDFLENFPFEAKQPEQSKDENKHLYPLDWNETEVKLSKGRFTHTLRRPKNDLLLKREDDVDIEIPIAKDGSYGLPDPTGVEEIDAKYYEEIKADVNGYNGNIPTAHKSAAFQGLFVREIYLDPDCDVFGDEVRVIEEVGSGDEPDYTIVHILRGADEKETNSYRRKVNNGRLHPDKRQRQKFVQKSTLRTSMAFYFSLLTRMEGVKIDNQPYSDGQRNAFIAETNAYTQKEVVKVYVEALTGNLLD